MTFSEWLRNKYRDLSQREMAEELGVSQAHVSRLLSGNRLPSAELVARLAHRFPTERDELLSLFLPKNETYSSIAKP